MIITTKLSMDFFKQTERPWINAVQDDRYSRDLQITLYDNGEDWTPPEGVTVEVAYRKADGTSGWYDTMPDGTAAWSIDGNVLTAALAPQVLTAPGPVMLAVLFRDGEQNQLATFPMWIQVEPNPAMSAAKSEDYISVQQWMVDEVSKMVDALIESGELVGPQGPKGDKGDSYILTDDDKQEIIDILDAMYFSKEFFAEQTLTGFSGSDGHYYLEASGDFEFTAGDTYKVVWNGTEYICKCYTKASGGGLVSNGLFLGNASIFITAFADTEEPFFLMGGQNSMSIFTSEDAESHTLAIYHLVVDGDYLPFVTEDDNGKILQVVEGIWMPTAVDFESSAGGVLPEVTTDDNGKVLTVVDGVWAAAEQESAPGDKTVSWEDIQDKPFCDNGFRLTATAEDVDLDTAAAFVPADGECVNFAHVYDQTVTAEQLIGATLAFEYDGMVMDGVILTAENIVYADEKALLLAIAGDTAAVFFETGAMRIELDGNVLEGNVPKAGIYFPVAEDGTTIFDVVGEGITLALSKEDVKQIDPKYIPDEIKLPTITDADNGKVLEVVDGSWTAVAVADSAVASYIESYIDEALGGDY